MRAATRPVAGSTRSRQPNAGQVAETQTAPSPAARPQVLPGDGRGKARTAFVAGSIRTSCPRPRYLSAHSALSPKDSAEAWTPILDVTLPVRGSTRRMPALPSTHRLPAPKATPVRDAPGSPRNWLARSVCRLIRSTALPVVTHAAPSPVATPATPGSWKVVVSAARRGPCSASRPGAGPALHAVLAAARAAAVTTAHAVPLHRRKRSHVPPIAVCSPALRAGLVPLSTTRHRRRLPLIAGAPGTVLEQVIARREGCGLQPEVNPSLVRTNCTWVPTVVRDTVSLRATAVSSPTPLLARAKSMGA
jgi:hypothetical protein